MGSIQLTLQISSIQLTLQMGSIQLTLQMGSIQLTLQMGSIQLTLQMGSILLCLACILKKALSFDIIDSSLNNIIWAKNIHIKYSKCKKEHSDINYIAKDYFLWLLLFLSLIIFSILIRILSFWYLRILFLLRFWAT